MSKDAKPTSVTVFKNLLATEKGKESIYDSLCRLKTKRKLTDVETQVMAFCESWIGVKKVIERIENDMNAKERRKGFRVIK